MCRYCLKNLMSASKYSNRSVSYKEQAAFSFSSYPTYDQFLRCSLIWDKHGEQDKDFSWILLIYSSQVCLVQRAGSLLLLLLPILHEAPLGAPCRLALCGEVVIKIEMQKTKHVHCIFILINRHGHIKSIF